MKKRSIPTGSLMLYEKEINFYKMDTNFSKPSMEIY